ncbi:hypothetical protein CMUS01_07082 [Colletotrichum musicola]|uniref:Uncharacterized protein n=1 Tax=Colletotrichum musicola TaxID=2175873 RepID=A0A8H6NGW3_9PEZI|nr:hypothetical protein CMUS01_07082 [Colletotrichum musicola]
MLESFQFREVVAGSPRPALETPTASFLGPVRKSAAMRLFPIILLVLEASQGTQALRFRNAHQVPLNSVTSSPTPRLSHRLRFRAASPQVQAVPTITVSMPAPDVPSAIASMTEKMNSIASSMSANLPQPTVPVLSWDSQPSSLSPPAFETSSPVISAPSQPPELRASNTAATTTPTPTLSSSPAAGPNNTGAIVGGVVGGLAVVAIAVCVVVWMFLRRRREAKHARTPAAEMEATQKMAGPYAEEESRDDKSRAVLAEAPANEVHEAPGDNALGTPGNAAELIVGRVSWSTFGVNLGVEIAVLLDFTLSSPTMNEELPAEGGEMPYFPISKLMWRRLRSGTAFWLYGGWNFDPQSQATSVPLARHPK